MDRAWWDRWSPLSGVVFVILLVVALIVIGEFPGVGDPAEEFAAFYQDDRGRILAGAIIFAASLIFFLWFAAAMASRVRDRGERRLSAAVLAGGAAFAGMSLVAIGMFTGIAHTAAEEADPAVIKGLDALAGGVDIMSAFPFAVLVLAFGIAVMRSAVVASWFGHLSVVVAIIVALGGTTWARDGFWGPYGGYAWIMFIVLLAWVLATSLLLVTRPTESETPAPSSPSRPPPP